MNQKFSGKGHRDRWGIAFAAFIALFLAVIAAIVWFIAAARPPVWDCVVLGVGCAVLALIPALLFYLLHMKKRMAGTNFFLYDAKTGAERALGDITDGEITQRLRIYMDAAVSSHVQLAESRYARWLDRHVGKCPSNYFMFFILRTFQFAVHAKRAEDADALFLQVDKLYFDELTARLYQVGADELAISVQYYRAIYPENKEFVLDALRGKMDYLDQCLVHYVREHIGEFSN